MSTPDPNTLQEDFTLLQPPAEVAVPPAKHAQVVDSHTYYYVLGGLLLALIAFVAIWKLRKYAKRRAYEEAVDATALRELRQWEGLNDRERYREAVSEISATVRRYVDARFGLRAPTLTTEEFWDYQRAEGKIPRAHEPFWEQFFAVTDGIKYAGLTPDHEQFRQLLASAVDFVQSSRQGRGR